MAACAGPSSGSSTTWCEDSTRKVPGMSCSFRSASTTTAFWRTEPCCAGKDPAAAPVGFLRAFATAAGFALEQAALRVRGRWFRFGYACVNFGTPLSLRQHFRATGIDPRRLSQEQRRAQLESLGGLLMDGVKAIIPVLPVAVVARVFRARGDRPMEALKVKAEASALAERLALRGAPIYLPRGDQDYAIEVGLRMLVLRRIVVEEDGLFSANPAETRILEYYANSIAHFLV